MHRAHMSVMPSSVKSRYWLDRNIEPGLSDLVFERDFRCKVTRLAHRCARLRSLSLITRHRSMAFLRPKPVMRRSSSASEGLLSRHPPQTRTHTTAWCYPPYKPRLVTSSTRSSLPEQVSADLHVWENAPRCAASWRDPCWMRLDWQTSLPVAEGDPKIDHERSGRYRHVTLGGRLPSIRASFAGTVSTGCVKPGKPACGFSLCMPPTIGQYSMHTSGASGQAGLLYRLGNMAETSDACVYRRRSCDRRH